MTTLFVESALRSLLMAATLWAGMRLLRVSNVVAQKIAWSLVLVASIAMPLLVRSFSGRPLLALPASYIRPLSAPDFASHVSAAARTNYDVTIPVATTHRRSVVVAPAVIPIHPANTEPLSETPTMHLQPVVPAARWHWPRPAAMVLPAYLGVSAILLLRICIGLVIAARIWYRAERASPIPEPRATVRISSILNSPVTIGSGIVLPESHTEWEPTKLRIVLAHERSHVRQGDFYLQLLAALYTAVFWFSPLGWWLQRKLADLGEAISDRAALDEAANRSSYAEVLLEFAAVPHRAYAGVAMARSRSIQRRIDLLLTDHQFRLAFIAVRRHAMLALVLVPLALFAATALVGVQAAQSAVPPAPSSAPAAVMIAAPPLPAAAPVAGVSSAPAVPSIAPGAPTDGVLVAPEDPAPAPVAPTAIAPPAASLAPMSISVALPQVMIAVAPQDLPAPPRAPLPPDHSYYGYSYSDSGDSFAIIDGDSLTINGSGRLTPDIEKAKKTHHGAFVWFERNGKSYIIDDPVTVGRCRELFRPIEELGRQQAELGEKQAKLGEEQARLGELQAKVAIPMPNIEKELALLDEQLKHLHELSGKELNIEQLADLQDKLGDLQGKLGELQGLAGSKESEFGERQAKIGREQGQLGEKEGLLGQQEGLLSNKANEKMKSLIDEAFKNGKAKPFE